MYTDGQPHELGFFDPAYEDIAVTPENYQEEEAKGLWFYVAGIKILVGMRSIRFYYETDEGILLKSDTVPVLYYGPKGEPGEQGPRAPQYFGLFKPASPEEGDWYLDAATGYVQEYRSGAWHNLSYESNSSKYMAAINDAMGSLQLSDETLPMVKAMTAWINNLTANYAFINNIFTKKITLAKGGEINAIDYENLILQYKTQEDSEWAESFSGKAFQVRVSQDDGQTWIILPEAIRINSVREKIYYYSYVKNIEDRFTAEKKKLETPLLGMPDEYLIIYLYTVYHSIGEDIVEEVETFGPFKADNAYFHLIGTQGKIESRKAEIREIKSHGVSLINGSKSFEVGHCFVIKNGAGYKVKTDSELARSASCWYNEISNEFELYLYFDSSKTFNERVFIDDNTVTEVNISDINEDGSSRVDIPITTSFFIDYSSEVIGMYKCLTRLHIRFRFYKGNTQIRPYWFNSSIKLSNMERILYQG